MNAETMERPARGPRSARRLTRGLLLALSAPVLLAAHTLAFSASVSFAEIDSWRRLWSDLAVATATWIDARYGPAPERVVARGEAAESHAREMLLRRRARGTRVRPTPSRRCVTVHSSSIASPQSQSPTTTRVERRSSASPSVCGAGSRRF